MATVFLTTAQAQRIAAISLDALTGVQFDTDDSDQSDVTGCYVPIASPSSLRFFSVTADGDWTDQT